MKLSSFLKAGMGNAIALIISLLSFPVLTRLYSPSEFAPWAIGVAFVMLIGAMSTFRYELAMTLERNNRNAGALFWLCLGSSLIVFLIACVLIQFFSYKGWLFRETLIEHSKYLVGLWLLLVIVNQIWNGWQLHHGAFLTISIAHIFNAITSNLVRFYGAFVGDGGSSWLVIGSISGQIVAFLIFSVSCLPISRRPPPLSKCYNRIKGLAWKHRYFAFYSLPFTFFNSLRDRVPILIVGYWSASTSTGLYSQAWRFSFVPVGLIGGSLRPVLFHAAANAGLESLEFTIRRILILLITFGTPAAALIINLPNDFFAFLLGEKWRDIGFFLAILVFPALISSLSNWMDRLLDAAGKQNINLWTEITVSILSTLSLVLMLQGNFPLHWAVVVQSTILVLNYILVIYLTFRVAGFKINFLLHLLLYAIGLFLVVSLLLGMIW